MSLTVAGASRGVFGCVPPYGRCVVGSAWMMCLDYGGFVTGTVGCPKLS